MELNAEKKQIANTMRELRKGTKLSQEKFAEKVGVTKKAVEKWEQEGIRPNTSTIEMIGKAIGKTKDEIEQKLDDAAEFDAFPPLAFPDLIQMAIDDCRITKEEYEILCTLLNTRRPDFVPTEAQPVKWWGENGKHDNNIPGQCSSEKEYIEQLSGEQSIIANLDETKIPKKYAKGLSYTQLAQKKHEIARKLRIYNIWILLHKLTSSSLVPLQEKSINLKDKVPLSACQIGHANLDLINSFRWNTASLDPLLVHDAAVAACGYTTGYAPFNWMDTLSVCRKLAASGGTLSAYAIVKYQNGAWDSVLQGNRRLPYFNHIVVDQKICLNGNLCFKDVDMHRCNGKERMFDFVTLKTDPMGTVRLKMDRLDGSPHGDTQCVDLYSFELTETGRAFLDWYNAMFANIQLSNKEH